MLWFYIQKIPLDKLLKVRNKLIDGEFISTDSHGAKLAKERR